MYILHTLKYMENQAIKKNLSIPIELDAVLEEYCVNEYMNKQTAIIRFIKEGIDRRQEETEWVIKRWRPSKPPTKQFVKFTETNSLGNANAVGGTVGGRWTTIPEWMMRVSRNGEYVLVPITKSDPNEWKKIMYSEEIEDMFLDSPYYERFFDEDIKDWMAKYIKGEATKERIAGYIVDREKFWRENDELTKIEEENARIEQEKWEGLAS